VGLVTLCCVCVEPTVRVNVGACLLSYYFYNDVMTH
jgi:hypothetical protein